MRCPSSPSLLLLYCFLVGSLAQGDYDEDNTNGDDRADLHTNDTSSHSILCPRSFPGEKMSFNNTTYLCIGKGSREHLFSWVSTSLVPSLYTLVFLVGLPANGLALWVLAAKIQKLPSTIFLMNLAVADLLLVLILPFKISYYFLGHHWVFQEGLCRLVTAFFYGNMYCSMLLLACISLDRYLAIVHPFFSRSVRSPAFAVGLCAIVWLGAASLTLPLTAQRQSYPLHGSSGLILCHDVLPQDEQASHFLNIFVCLVLLGFLLPLLVILFCYGSVIYVLVASGKTYGYAIKLTVLVLASAVTLFTPSNILLLIHYSDPRANGFGDLYFWYVLSLAVSTVNSCVDPFIYYYVSEEFRDKIKRKLCQQDERTLAVQKTSKEDVVGLGTRSTSLI
ncbi:proteinase-activated receptor 4 [Phascolarctos cinereus]|uniref:Proteinase-activated receptor 4 n=1 Tax=Phascolarctos cinereus TaxID=38626 RepID=A0A6P5J1D5_PHACI|nr:proteinase-activated receptor 4 [Phascolarctos cinereus]